MFLRLILTATHHAENGQGSSHDHNGVTNNATLRIHSLSVFTYPRDRISSECWSEENKRQVYVEGGEYRW